MPIRPMRPGDRDSVFDLLEVAFGRDARFVMETYADFDPLFKHDDFLLDVDGGAPLSCVQVFEKRIRLCGTEALLGGIGSVATAPESRNQGRAAELMRRQTDAMRERGMLLALLFAGPTEFYEKLDWHAIPMRQVGMRRTPSTKPLEGREFRDTDLPKLRTAYDSYCQGRDGTTVRDDAYWRGQLRYSAGPEHRFRVLERDGRIDAYARASELSGYHVLLEYAPAPGRARELARLIAGLVPNDGMLLVRLTRDAELERGLAEAGLEVFAFPDPTPMWRVLDRAALARLTRLPPDSSDLELLSALDVHYWLSDRF